MKVKTLLFGMVIVLAGLLFGGGRAGAAAPTGITVSPAFQMVTVQPGASAQLVSFKITNNEPTTQSLSFSTRDFNTLNESGGLFFVGTNPTALQKKYGLAKWFSLSTNNLTIPPHQAVTLSGQILNQPDLSAGGHYGALMISLGGGQANGKVSLHPIASSLLFVTKPQGAIYELSLSNIYFKHSFASLPANVTLRFQNTGNTHVVPRGSVYIKDPNGNVVSKGIINQNSNIILPSTYRQYKVGLNKVSNASAVGSYKLHVDFRFDGINQYRSYQSSLFYISMQKLIALILIIAAFLLTIASWWSRTKHKRPKK